jgi:triacylglycerol lipase
VSTARHHVVLIPGFAGFDALGQLEYYAGVTPIFGVRGDAVLHYFDNFPTAAVETRAARLLAYLAKRIARGEIKEGDDVTLIGHSTGGLDIRRLICDLSKRSHLVAVDGGVTVKPEAILHAIRRVVFLSVPQWGTNIADWVRSHSVWREIIVAELRAALSGTQLPVVDRLGAGMTGAVARVTGAGLFRAVQDALREADGQRYGAGFARLAEAHEAASQLDLYFRHIASDFRAIDDLSAARPEGEPSSSPAHFLPHERERELRTWQALRIQVRSYATVGPRLFRFEAGRPAPVWLLTNPWEGAEVAKPSGRTDVVYRALYRASAGGPFIPPPDVPWELEAWDNDGIVNTASMVWPLGEAILLEADHMDIVGHYASLRAPAGSARSRRAYDLLGSGSAFDAARFKKLWEEVFVWATPASFASSARMSSAFG